jgi:hypothetical protein
MADNGQAEQAAFRIFIKADIQRVRREHTKQVEAPRPPRAWLAAALASWTR